LSLRYMPICLKCNERFPNRIIIDGKVRVLNSRKYCLTCSPFGLHNTRPIDYIRILVDIEIKCSQCGRIYVYRRGIGHSKTKCNSCVVNTRRFKIKVKAVEYKGGKCNSCGYSKCLDALHFHHRDEQ